jgi:hypothetical protein
MKPMIIMPTRRRASLLAKVFALLAMTGLANAAFPQSHLSPPAGDGWQMLEANAASPAAPGPTASLAMANPAPSAPATSHASPPPVLAPFQAVAPTFTSTAVTPVVLPGAQAAAGSSALTLTITPQDINLRNALDRWLQQQGWQLAWKIDDDLPLEFNATFSGDFDSLLTQVMRATNHMRTPTRVCEHINNVIRVVARAANCQD